MNRYLNLHSLTAHSGVLLVRDANGRPKELPFGTATRTMLSPQTQRRAQRTHLREQANRAEGPLAPYAFGIRTREWARITARALTTRDWTEQDAARAAKEALTSLGVHFGSKERTADLTKVLIFAPESAGEDIAGALDEHRAEVDQWLTDLETTRKTQEKNKKKRKTDDSETPDDTASEEEAKTPPLPRAIKNKLLAALAPADAIDIALFGRFLAEIAETPNVDGALQTMPAITVSRAAGIDDFYSAADDAKLTRRSRPTRPAGTSALDVFDDNGAGMTGYQSLTSGTFYAHSVLDRYKLRDNLTTAGMSPDTAEAAARAAEAAFIDAFCNAVPTAKQNTTAAPGTLPKLVLAFTDNRQHNYVGCFEDAIDETTAPASLQATRRLLDHHRMIIRKRGIDPGRVLTYDLAIAQLLNELRSTDNLPATEVDTTETLAAPHDPALHDLTGMPA